MSKFREPNADNKVKLNKTDSASANGKKIEPTLTDVVKEIAEDVEIPGDTATGIMNLQVGTPTSGYFIGEIIVTVSYPKRSIPGVNTKDKAKFAVFEMTRIYEGDVKKGPEIVDTMLVDVKTNTPKAGQKKEVGKNLAEFFIEWALDNWPEKPKNENEGGCSKPRAANLVLVDESRFREEIIERNMRQIIERNMAPQIESVGQSIEKVVNFAIGNEDLDSWCFRLEVRMVMEQKSVSELSVETSGLIFYGKPSIDQIRSVPLIQLDVVSGEIDDRSLRDAAKKIFEQIERQIKKKKAEAAKSLYARLESVPVC